MTKFQVIVADPAWMFNDKLEMSTVPRGAAANYPVLDLEEIKKLKVQELADSDGCILALWVPGSMLQDGLDVMKAWSFNQKQIYTWVKTKKKESITKDIKKSILKLIKQVQRKAIRIDNGKPITYKDFDFILDESVLSFGMGHLFRQTHEVCLIGINNNKIYKSLENKSQRSVSFGENLKHSAKPEHLQNSLELMFPEAKKLEMFARRKRNGWAVIGNEVCEGEDIRDSIQNLLDLNEDSPVK